MPLPLILWGLGTVAAAGLGLGAKAVYDTSAANNINDDAASISKNAKAKLDKMKQHTNASLENYGKQKLSAFQTKIGGFVELYGQLRKVEISRSTELDNLQLGNFASGTVKDLKESYNTLVSITQGFAGGLASGTLVAYGAYTGVVAFGTTGTGTAIGGLSGITATNATLAWLGGGTLVSGGAGMAGGTLVLGGLVVGPALLIFGSIFAAKASQKLSEARSNEVNAKEYNDEINLACNKLEMIQEVVGLASDILSKAGGMLRRANNDLGAVIYTSGTDYSTFSDSEKDTVFKAMKYAQLVKAIVDKPVLTESGVANDNTSQELININKKLA